jgi:hypothetical protein
MHTKIVVRSSQGKRPFGRITLKCISDAQCMKRMGWIGLVQDRVQW